MTGTNTQATTSTAPNTGSALADERTVVGVGVKLRWVLRQLRDSFPRDTRAVARRSWRAALILLGTTAFLQSVLEEHPTLRASVGGAAGRTKTWISDQVPAFGWAGLVLALAVLAGPLFRSWLRSLRAPERTLSALASVAVALLVFLLLSGGGGWWFPPLVSLLVAVLRGASGVALERQRASALSNVDAPITRNDEDLFEREAIVTRCAAYLTNNNIRCPRVALTAEVGMGKTSVANLVCERLQNDGHLFIRFDPWHHENREDLFSALIATIDDGLASSSIHSGLFAKQRTVLRDWIRGVLGKHSWVSGFRIPVESRLAISQTELADRIRESLDPGRRLVIFVDDLERCSEETVTRLLVDTRELIDAPGISYLYAIDDTRLSTGNDDGKDDAQWLLQKTFDLQLRVPEPRFTELAKLDNQVLGQLDGRAIKTALRELGSTLPVSPRERKRFITQVMSWPFSVTSAPEWMSMSMLVSLLLLEFRAQGSLTFVWRSELAITDLQTGAFRMMAATALRREDNDRSDQLRDSPWAAAESGPEAYESARRIGMDVRDVRSHLEWLMTGTHSPRQQLERRLRAAVDSSRKASDLVEVRAAFAEADATDMQNALVQLRESLVSEAADAVSREEQERLLDMAVLVSRSRMLVAERNPDSIRDPDLFQRALGAFLRFAHFGGIYREAHDEEWRALEMMVRSAPELSLRFWAEVEERMQGGLDPGQESCVVAIRDALAPTAAALLLDMLSEGSILSRDDPTYERQRALLLDPDSAFHSADIRKRLVSLMESVELGKSAWDAVRRVWANFMEAIERNQQGALRLARDRDWVDLLWEGLTRSPMNRRTAGGLHQSIQKMQEVDPQAYVPPMPDWWDDVMAETSRPWQPAPATSARGPADADAQRVTNDDSEA